MATNPILQQKVLQLIKLPFVQLINFEINGLRVTGQRYAMLADLISNGTVECHVDSYIKPKIKGHYQAGTQVEAMFDTLQHALVFRTQDYGQDKFEDGYNKDAGDASFEKRNMFHEATHAIFDVFTTSGEDHVRGLEDEVVAVLAEAYFVKLCPGYSSTTFDGLAGGSGQRALELFKELKERTHDFQDRTVQVLRLPDYRLLKEAVAIEWDYLNHLPQGGSDRSDEKHIYTGLGLPFTRALDTMPQPRPSVPDWWGKNSRVKQR
jgi:hypothetical protein